jgi:hypothetical protein
MQKQRLQQKSKGDERGAECGAKSKRRKVVPGIELGLPESESDVLTITLYNHVISLVPGFINIITNKTPRSLQLAQYCMLNTSSMSSNPLISIFLRTEQIRLCNKERLSERHRFLQLSLGLRHSRDGLTSVRLVD